MILAIDIGGTKLAAALINENNIIDRHRVNTPKSGRPDDLIAALQELVAPLKNRAELVAVASTGIINQGRLTAVNPDNLGGMNDFPLQSVLEDITNIPVTLLNDAQSAAWGEYCQLNDGSPQNKSYQNMAFITVSTGVGAGLVIDGQLQTGASGLAGHAGHISIDINGPKCGCGRTGCVEALASGTAIGIFGSQIYHASMDGKAVFERYHAGDQGAQMVVDRSARSIAELLGNLRALLDIEVVVIGGSVGLAEGYLDRVHYFMKQLPDLFRVEIKPACLGHEAGLIGVSLWASQACLSQ